MGAQKRAKQERKKAKPPVHPATDHPAFELNTEAKNLRDIAEHFIPCEEWHVLEWCPQLEGQGDPTQVHIMIKPHEAFTKALGLDCRFFLRMKSKEACDAMIATLNMHRNNVWGDT